jgi:hypothetical protein
VAVAPHFRKRDRAPTSVSDLKKLVKVPSHGGLSLKPAAPKTAAGIAAIKAGQARRWAAYRADKEAGDLCLASAGQRSQRPRQSHQTYSTRRPSSARNASPNISANGTRNETGVSNCPIYADYFCCAASVFIVVVSTKPYLQLSEDNVSGQSLTAAPSRITAIDRSYFLPCPALDWHADHHHPRACSLKANAESADCRLRGLTNTVCAKNP